MLRRALAILVLSTVAVRDARAHTGEDGAVDRSVGASALSDDRGWPAGTIEQQLDRDPTLVPYGKGAIFVPAMTNPLDEPTVAVLSGRELVAEGTTGARIVLSPGTYEVRLGSGTEQTRLKLQATVRESQTAVIPPAWAGLAVHVVDEQFSSLRGSYELIRVDDREYIGIGFGTDEQAGEPVTTWILRPGLYKIVRVGENYRARRDFTTVRLAEGQLTHFVLVLDPETLDFRGGGEIPEAEVFKAGDGNFGSVVLGGDASMNSTSNVPGQPDGVGFTVRAFADARVGLQLAGSPLLFRLQLEEGQTKSPDLPWRKGNDRLKLDALYVYELYPWLGPYVRAGAETNLLPGYEYFASQRKDVTLTTEDGALLRTDLGVDRVELSESFGRTPLKEGAGINVRLFKSLLGESSLRAGIGARHRLTNGLFELVPGTSTATSATYRRIPEDNQVGVEATLLASARLTRWVTLNLELDSLFPFTGLADVVLDLEATLTLKLTTYVSVVYRPRYQRDPTLLARDVLQQDVLLRFSLELL
ncbi:DUF3078 domain-containing protein [Myxococcota bacterium]|nr:DUF3078 domain-containing protein [Myxococcota bacterium]